MVRSRIRGVLTGGAGVAFAVGLFVLASVLSSSASQATNSDAQPLGFTSWSGCGAGFRGEQSVPCLVFVVPASEPRSTGVRVFADFRAFGGPASVQLTPFLLGADWSPDLTFWFELRIPSDMSPGRKSIPLTAYDIQGRAGRGSGGVTVLTRQGYYDFNDLAVYSHTTGFWTIRHSSLSEQFSSIGWGHGAGDVPVPGDYDGEGPLDVAIYRRSTGEWWILFSGSDYSYATWVVHQWGLDGDVPVPADFDGDGRTDLAVYRPSNGSWYVRFSADAYSYATWVVYQWGLADDIPLPGDYDGDGRADLAVFRPATSEWFIRRSSDGYSFATWQSFQWGLAGDRAVPADFDGDGRLDLVVFRPSEGRWYVRFSGSEFGYAGWLSYQWGLPGDIPVAGDVDGDGRADLVVWRPVERKWYVRFSADNYSYSTFATFQTSHKGSSGDVPVGGR
jgi:hypothetical protein